MAHPSVAAQVKALDSMSVPQLRDRWREVFGQETQQRHRVYMIKRIAWKLQEDQLPKLTPEQEARVAAHRRDLETLSPSEWFPGAGRGKRAPVAPRKRQNGIRDPRLPQPGAVLTREFRGQTVAVRVLDRGFEYEGRVYRSLSAIAREVTGTSWNGPLFFGLSRKAGR